MRLDHVLLGIADLEAGIRQFQELTGVEPRRGGRHPEMGTCNALVSLGQGEYLEVIAPELGGELTPMFERLKSIGSLTPVMWAMAVDDADEVAAHLAAEGHAVVGPQEGSRVQQEGGVLEWRLVTTPGRGPFTPFFIEWAPGTLHPSETAPAGCALASMEIAHPEPAALDRLLEPLGPRVRAPAAERAALSFSLDCPLGPVRFSSS
jgi:hypothetical protein